MPDSMLETNSVGSSDAELFYGIFLYISIVNLLERFAKNDYWFQTSMPVNEHAECCSAGDSNPEAFI